MGFVYKIENQINGHAYIGKTRQSSPEKRWNQHIRDAMNPNRPHHSQHFALAKYGIENFSFEVLEETDQPESREIYYISIYNTYENGYNETLGGDGKPRLHLCEEMVCKEYLDGKSVRSIAKENKCDVLAIRNVLKKNGITIRSGGFQRVVDSNRYVAMLDKNTKEILKVFESAISAEEYVVGRKTGHVASVCVGKRKSADGYCWKYVSKEVFLANLDKAGWPSGLRQHS